MEKEGLWGILQPTQDIFYWWKKIGGKGIFVDLRLWDVKLAFYALLKIIINLNPLGAFFWNLKLVKKNKADRNKVKYRQAWPSFESHVGNLFSHNGETSFLQCYFTEPEATSLCLCMCFPTRLKQIPGTRRTQRKNMSSKPVCINHTSSHAHTQTFPPTPWY